MMGVTLPNIVSKIICVSFVKQLRDTAEEPVSLVAVVFVHRLTVQKSRPRYEYYNWKLIGLEVDVYIVREDIHVQSAV